MMYSNLGGLNPDIGVRGLGQTDEDILQRYNDKLRAQSLLQNQALMQNQLQNQAALINAGGKIKRYKKVTFVQKYLYF